MRYTEPKKFFRIEIQPIDAADLLEEVRVPNGIKDLVYVPGDKILFDKSGNYSFMESWIFEKHYKEMQIPQQIKLEETLTVMNETI